MEYKKIYEEWLENPYFDEETKKELLSMKDNEEEIQDRFYKELEFGTAGLRGKIGAGTNRMNLHIIGRVTQGLADFIIEKGQEYMKRGVVIAYDCRHFSKEFAKRTALVLAANGIVAYLFESLRPTPELSFAVRHLRAASGIVVTASHNPKDYNGYKVYWEEGSQIISEVADGITQKIHNISDFSHVKIIEEEMAKEKELLKIIGKEIDDLYIEKVKELSLREDIDKDIKIVYTPLNGTGNIPVRRVLKERGFKNIEVVKEQENPDPDFTTVGYPNPEDTKAFLYAQKLGKKIKADLLIATDPDCDRLGVMVKDESGEYVSLNGNQVGAIFIDYILKSKKDIKNGYIVKSIVTGDLGKNIAKSYQVKTYETLTGFKNICGKVNELEEEGKEKFLFGYEESIGYVAGTFVRDKDGVIAAMLICEGAAYYKKQGKSLLDILEEIYKEHGYYQEKLISLVLEGIEGQKRIKRMMEVYRKEYPTEIGEKKIAKYMDYGQEKAFDFLKQQEEKVEIPVSDVLKFLFDDGSWYAIRPSGTEPKIKIYIYTKGDTIEEAQDKIKEMESVIMEKLNEVK
ncbi:phospho-sugar mutase [Anaerophilus nitritogenes]|uniref:phospho-sugar mutase n=1 Tax=Anaerophilus nitritogenes TaxID=2498136 RepID=UPI00101CA854|nr:phospho-sugar mutase [Anaerophilus nitritogenes]